MSLLTHTGTELSARELLRTLAGPIEDGDRDAARAVLDEIEALALDVATGDEATIVARRDELDLAVRRLAASDVNAVVGYVIGRIEGIDHELGRQETRLLGRRAAERDEEERVGIRTRVLEALADPVRPAVVAERIGCDPSQVSRAIRELVASRQVVAVEPPHPHGDDRRARWYQRADVVARAA
jgi:hypothetical protein